jgi:glucose/mannose transport system substrate-binding protein
VSAADDWLKDKIVPSLWHGAAAPDSFKNDFETVVVTFAAERDVDLATQAAQAIAINSGVVKSS